MRNGPVLNQIFSSTAGTAFLKSWKTKLPVQADCPSTGARDSWLRPLYTEGGLPDSLFYGSKMKKNGLRQGGKEGRKTSAQNPLLDTTPFLIGSSLSSPAPGIFSLAQTEQPEQNLLHGLPAARDNPYKAFKMGQL